MLVVVFYIYCQHLHTLKLLYHFLQVRKASNPFAFALLHWSWHVHFPADDGARCHKDCDADVKA